METKDIQEIVECSTDDANIYIQRGWLLLHVGERVKVGRPFGIQKIRIDRTSSETFITESALVTVCNPPEYIMAEKIVREQNYWHLSHLQKLKDAGKTYDDLTDAQRRELVTHYMHCSRSS